MKYSITSFFSGAGGLDLGFHNAGFNIQWANEFNQKTMPTLKKIFPHTFVDNRNMTEIPFDEIPSAVGIIIGGPPCQSWSEAGPGKGLDDIRGQVFLTILKSSVISNHYFFWLKM